MNGDFSRVTFDPTKHFSQVLQQQGRVMLDADTNEQTAILLHYIRTLAADLIGPFAGPHGEGLGFKIWLSNNFDPNNPEFSIGKGRYYVDGILCENHEDSTYSKQKRYPHPKKPLPQEANNVYLIYLDVWEHHISYVEDDSIREKALDGPDTASRAEVVCQVKLQPIGASLFQNNEFSYDDWKNLINTEWQPMFRGCLQAQIEPSDIPNSLCESVPDSKYRGPENQLYRVEIHKGGNASEATFKWSRDNGSVVTRIVEGTFAGTSCTVESSRGFESGNWVEFSNDEQELRGEPGTLVKVIKVENKVLTLHSEPKPLSTLDDKETWPTKVRRWDQVKTKKVVLTEDGVIHVKENEWLDLEDGLQIRFQPSVDGQHPIQYRTGDYWLIPARVASGNIEWPVDPDGPPTAQPPFGIQHHYAPLAIITQNPTEIHDLRITFRPMDKPEPQPYLDSYGEAGIGGEPSCE